MNPWWLFLIIPASVYFGALIMAILAAAGKEMPDPPRRSTR